ncbi:MAG: M23 family metallopeptidase [Candidatus Moranbacteria bacterium]|nr:M23 family metallopeptidase [Candidatus Moranbacteria bacterium]
MNKKIIILAFVIFFFAAVIIYNLWIIVSIKQTVVENNLPSKVKDIVTSQITSGQKDQAAPTPVFGSPLDRAGERVTKKPFGIFVTPQNSPVQPEHFRGYHTGTDFEIFPEESNADVSVRAICDGKIAVKKTATGYGGVLVESCELDGQPITVIYGHLKLSSITNKVGDALAKGEEIGILGKAYSAETSGERKHLHLGVHKGTTVNILGYVQNQSELSGWIDPCSLETVCQ